MTNGYQGPPPQAGGLPQSQSLQRLREKHEQLRKKHEQQKSQMESKGQDLRLAQVLVRALDPSLPKGFRQLGLKQVAQIVGVDPKGANVKEMIGVLSGLDPQSLEGLRRGVTEDISQMQPGQVTEVTKGLLSGSIPPEKMLGMIAGALQPTEMKPPKDAGEASMEPPMKLGGPIVTEEAKASLPDRAPVGPQGTPLAPQPLAEEPRYTPKLLPPGQREASGELPAVFGIEPGRYSLSDIRKAGWDRIPDDPTKLKEMVDDVTTMQAGVLTSTSLINQVAALARGRPEVLDLSFNLPYGGGPISFNPSATVEAAKEFFTGMDNWLGRKVKDETDLNDPKLAEAAKKVGEGIFHPGTDMTADEIASTRSRINSMMVPLAYAMARARHGTGVLSNQDVMAQLDSLGKSQSPDVLLAALQSTTNQLYSQYNQTTRVMTGKEVPIAHLATDDFMQIVHSGGLTPKGMFKEAEATEGGPTRIGVAPEKQKIARPGGEAIEEMERREIAFGEEQKGMLRERQQMAREAAGREEERLELAKRGEERAIASEEKRAAERRAERVQAAFVELGRAFRSEPVQVPGVGGGGAPMNPAAFQAGQIQRRQAPVIPQNVRRR